MDGETKFDSKYGIVIGLIVIALGGLAYVILSHGSLPVSDKMSDDFKKQAFHTFTNDSCLVGTLQPQNTADERALDLLNQCESDDHDMYEISANPYMTDSLKEKYNSLASEKSRVRGELKELFKSEGLDADAERSKALQKYMPHKK